MVKGLAVDERAEGVPPNIGLNEGVADVAGVLAAEVVTGVGLTVKRLGADVTTEGDVPNSGLIDGAFCVLDNCEAAVVGLNVELEAIAVEVSVVIGLDWEG